MTYSINIKCLVPNISIVLLALFFITGCNVTADEKVVRHDSPEYMKSLGWAESADVEKDVNAAIEVKDYRLLVLAGRGERALGVSLDTVDALKQRCGVKYLSGSTDVIRGDEHLQLLKKAHDYAKSYNKVMAKYCSEQVSS